MTTINRRGFLTLLAGAVAASAANGFAAIPSALPKAKKLKARHLWQYDITEASGAGFIHRIDVVVEGNQYGVDFISHTQKPSAKELEPALIVLANHVNVHHGESFDLDVRSFQLHDPEAYRYLQ